MKTLQFNTGGQPIFLEDLGVLQSQNDALRNTLDLFVRHMTGKSEPLGILDPSKWDDHMHGYIYWHGVILPCTLLVAVPGENEGEYTYPSDSIKIVIRKNDTSRVMADGTTKVCTTEYRATSRAVDDETVSADDVHTYTLTDWRDYIIFAPTV